MAVMVCPVCEGMERVREIGSQRRCAGRGAQTWGREGGGRGRRDGCRMDAGMEGGMDEGMQEGWMKECRNGWEERDERKER